MPTAPEGRRTLGRQSTVLALVVFVALVLAAVAAADRKTNMVAHGGNIMPTSTTYAIFWLPTGTHYEPTTGNAATDAANDTNYENKLKQYFQDIGGSSIYATTTQYNGTNGAIGNNSTFGGSIVDTTAYPKTGTFAAPILDSDLTAEIETVRAAQGWPTGLNTEYFIYTGYQIQSNTGGTGAIQSGVDYCAYHSFYTSGSDHVVYANMPDARSLNGLNSASFSCDNFNYSGDTYADVEVNVTSHEHMEAVTDPESTTTAGPPKVYHGGWFDDVDHGAGENGDKCAYTYGITNPSGANLYMNNHPYLLQREWSNALGDNTTTFLGCALSYCPSAVPAICEPVLTYSQGATPGTIAGNPSDSIAVALAGSDPDNSEPATSVISTTSLPSDLARSGGDPLTTPAVTLGVHEPFTYSTQVSPTHYLQDGQHLTITSTLTYKNSLCSDQNCTSSTLDTARTAIVKTSTITVANAKPTLNLPSDQTTDYHDNLSFNISASDTDAGDSITLGASGVPAGMTFTDNGDRTGTLSGAPTAVPGVYTVTFTADDHHHTTTTSGTVKITVTQEETTTTYTGPTVIAAGYPVTLKATVLEDGTTALAPYNQPVTLTLGAQSCVGNVDVAGHVQCTIASVNAPLGTSVAITATFLGDAYYVGSSDTDTAVVFSFLSSGAFVLGDNTVAAAGPTTTLTWWGLGLWSAANSVSGGQPPASLATFTGWANTPNPKPPACGGTWSSLPTQLGSVFTTIPAYMGVLVSSTVTKSPSGFSGNIAKIVVVKPAFFGGPHDLAHGGSYGTVVTTYCG